MAVSDDIRDALVPHDVDLTRFEEGLRKRLAFLFVQLEDDLVREIASVDPTGPKAMTWKMRRKEALLESSRDIIRGHLGEAKKMTNSELRDLAELESKVALAATNSTVGVNLLTVVPPPSTLRAIASGVIIEGNPASNWWSRQAGNLQQRFSDEIGKGIIAGEDTGDLVRRVRGTHTGRFRTVTLASGRKRRHGVFTGGIMDTTNREATALVRTSVQAVANEARLQTLTSNDDVVKGLQALATLDKRTSAICRARSGWAWHNDGSPIRNSGATGNFPGRPPWHFNCRTTLIPVLYSWEELLARQKKPARQQSASALNDNPFRGKVHMEAVREYQAALINSKLGGFVTLNNYLRTGSTRAHGRNWPEDEVRETVQKMNASVEASPRLTADRDLYRGVRQIEEMVEGEVEVGKTFTDKGFGSTSTDRKLVTDKFAQRLNPGDTPAVIVIKMKKGQAALDMNKTLGQRGGEKEFVLQSGTTYKITNVRKQGTGRNMRRTVTVEVVDPPDVTGPDVGVRKMDSIKESPGTQASMNGQVAGDLSYEQWLRTQPDGVAKDVLGPGRFKMWKAGKIKMPDLIDQRGRELTLPELAERAKARTG